MKTGGSWAMALVGDALFCRAKGGTLSQKLDDERDKLTARVEQIPEDEFFRSDDNQLVDSIVAEASLKPIQVAFDRSELRTKDTTVETSDGFHDLLEVRGTLVTETFPFTGNKEFWHLQPSSFSNSPYGEINGNNLVIGISVPAEKMSSVKNYFEQTKTLISECLQAQKMQIEEFNAEIVEHISFLVRERRAHLAKIAELRRNW